MSTGTLYTYPNNFRAYKAQIAAQYSGAKVTVRSQPPEFKFGETNKTDAFLKKFPTGKVPAFESANGVTLFEPNAIAYFVANDDLRGKNAVDAAQVQQWVEFADNEILPASCTWVFPCMGAMQFNKMATEKAKEDVKKALGVLNAILLTKTYLVGERITLADISVCCNLLQLYQWVLEPEFRKSYVNTNRWFTTLVNQPEFKKVIGDFKMCEKMAQFDSKKLAELSGKAGGGGAKKEKQEKKPQQQPKKQEKKKPEPEEEEEEIVAKPAKDPFAELPKPNFNWDEWKKTYSNKDTEKEAIPYFWNHFDKENMSLWKCEYLYPEDLNRIFMTCNLVGGMMQRLDRMRKHSFGSMCIFGEDKKNTIAGLWFWRGHQLIFELSSDLQTDYESYKWTKVDPDSEEAKVLIKEYFTWEGEFKDMGGKEVNQGKIFK